MHKRKEGNILDWMKLYNMQEKLDTYIEKKHNFTGENLFNKKYLALLVELGELANETRSFKFWSLKTRNKMDVILEEFVDGIHFILSLGLDKGYRFQSKITNVDNDLTETDQFNQVFEKCIMFNKNQTEENYKALFESFLQLGLMLGIDESKIYEAYVKKNEENFNRQNEGY